MADVVVVAIIMAYIGFQGIINAQLAKIKLFSSKIEVMTTNNTQLQIGFFVFTVFCILGIINSLVVEKRVKGI
jgi:ABC-type spermidine/putrescine transport system permease subunit I